MRMDIALNKICGSLLSLSLAEAMKKEFPEPDTQVLITGPEADDLVKDLSFLSKEHLFEIKSKKNPMDINENAKYDLIICLQCLEHTKSLEIIKIDKKLYYLSQGQMVPLTKSQVEEAKQFMKQMKIKMKEGEPVVLQIHLKKVVSKIKNALKPGGACWFIGFMDADELSTFMRQNGFNTKKEHFSRFLSKTEAGRMRVLNANIFFAHSPHPAVEKDALDIIKRFSGEGRIIPFLKLQKHITKTEFEIIEPYISLFHNVFSDWSDFMKNVIFTAKKLYNDLTDKEKIYTIYSTVCILSGIP
ncbi:MAG: hypothetical protein J7K68_00630, partial [Candidatus Diapherotrites archaeon]|nr:hypothetical protein [Candidatus Diapherotrites archaeon]